MSLLKELATLNEGRTKDAIMDLIDKAIKQTDVSGMPYPYAISKIADTVKRLDYYELFGGASKTEIEDMVKGQFDEDDVYEAIDEDNWPKLVSQADEFRVERDQGDMVHIMDGEQSVRVSMPYDTWKKLATW